SDDPLVYRGNQTLVTHLQIYCSSLLEFYCPKSKIDFLRDDYLHWNPVTAGFLAEPWHWLYSSGVDYFAEKKGLLDILVLDGF
ncbi:MAG: hypothetical protein ABIN01_21045, partial [Ferruginibacter sp.]